MDLMAGIDEEQKENDHTVRFPDNSPGHDQDSEMKKRLHFSKNVLDNIDVQRDAGQSEYVPKVAHMPAAQMESAKKQVIRRDISIGKKAQVAKMVMMSDDEDEFDDCNAN